MACSASCSGAATVASRYWRKNAVDKVSGRAGWRLAGVQDINLVAPAIPASAPLVARFCGMGYSGP